MTLNNAFTTGQILTSTEMNNLPFGMADTIGSSSTYTLTTTLTQTTGMIVNWTADSSRIYRITYYEPAVKGTTVSSAYVALELRQTSTTGTQLQQALVQQGSAVQVTGSCTCQFTGTFASGPVSVLGCAIVTTTSGTPQLIRSGTARARITCEDIGPQ